jgi:phosphate starvation-inducible membrane PsiE
MVIGFSTFGYLNYIFSKPYESESKMITLFRQYFPFAVIPQILMLFYALYLRLMQYDLTMNRYFVIIFGLWLGFTSLYLIVSKKKSLSIITASLALLSFVISV